MGEKQNQKSNGQRKSGAPRKWLIAGVAVLTLVLAVVRIQLLTEDSGSGGWSQMGKDGVTLSGNPTEQENLEAAGNMSLEQQEQTVPAGMELPYQFEDGKLELGSIFPYTGTNPDCENEDGENIGGIVLTNKSEEHLAFANLTVNMSDGTALKFVVTDVPAGRTVWTFAVDNSSYDESSVCISVGCDSKFEPETSLLAEQVSVQVEGMKVTLTNTSNKELPRLEISCHCLFSEAYFGGGAYTYSAGPIAPGESASFTAADCYLGEAVPVRIALDG